MKFLTIFPSCENVHLIKDVGMVPYILHLKYGYDATIATYENGTYPFLKTEVKGLKLRFIKRRFNNDTLNVIIFIVLNFKKYDVLQVYHFSINSLLFLTLFRSLKYFNASKTYLKLDADAGILNLRLKGIGGAIAKNLMSKITIITVETRNLFDELNKKGLFKGNLQYMPNGFYDFDRQLRVKFEQKENLIITVGRIGTYQKNNEILLEAFKEFFNANNSWRLEIIGPIEKAFKIYISNYLLNNPQLARHIVFTDAINEREKLLDKYLKAKLFILTSRYEGFPLVFLEAIRSGCSIITTNIGAAMDITDNGRYGRIFQIGNTLELKTILLDITIDEAYLRMNCYAIQKYAYSNFYWPSVLAKVNFALCGGTLNMNVI